MSYADLQPQHFHWRLENAVGVVTLNRPERKNPLTFDSYAELRSLFQGLGATNEVKSVVITGAGGNFCSGGDVHEIIAPLTRMGSDELLQFTRLTGDLVLQMRLCPQPIIAAIDGVCAGAGACIAMAADMRLATPNARTAFLFTRVGLAGCDMGACAILPRIIGHGRASELLYTGREMTARRATPGDSSIVSWPPRCCRRRLWNSRRKCPRTHGCPCDDEAHAPSGMESWN